MLRLVFAFFDIALHRRGPDSVPASTFLLGALFVLNVAIGFAQLQFAPVPRNRVLPVLAVDVVLPMLFVWTLLRAFARERRFKQTANALLGTDVLLGAGLLPFLFMAERLEGDGSDTAIIQIAILAIMVWSLDISAYVLGRAIERPYFLSLALVLGFFLLEVNLQYAIVPLATT